MVVFGRRLYKAWFLFLGDLAITAGRPTSLPDGPQGVGDTTQGFVALSIICGTARSCFMLRAVKVRSWSLGRMVAVLKLPRSRVVGERMCFMSELVHVVVSHHDDPRDVQSSSSQHSPSSKSCRSSSHCPGEEPLWRDFIPEREDNNCKHARHVYYMRRDR